MKNVHTLKIGQRLKIPAWLPPQKFEIVEGFSGAALDSKAPEKKTPSGQKAEPARPAVPGAALKKVSPERIAAKPEQKYRPYEVKENETLSTIAEREMGTMHLWKELLSANKDKIPTPEKLRAGLKIRIPLNLIAHNGGAHDEEE